MKFWIYPIALALGLAACQSKTSDKGNTTPADSSKTAPAVEQPLKLSWEVKMISDGQDGEPQSSALLLVHEGKKVGIDTSIFNDFVSVTDPKDYKKNNIPEDAIFTGDLGGMDDHTYFYLKRKGESLEIWRRLAGMDVDDNNEYISVEGKWEFYRSIKLSDFK